MKLQCQSGGGGATSPNFTPDVWTQNVGKWVHFEPQVAKVHTAIWVCFSNSPGPQWPFSNFLSGLGWAMHHLSPLI